MKNYLLLFISIVIIMLGVVSIFEQNKPKVGPIGESVTNSGSLFTLILIIIAGLSFFALSIISILKEKK